MPERDHTENPFLQLPITDLRRLNSFVNSHNNRIYQQNLHIQHIKDKLELGIETRKKRGNRRKYSKWSNEDSLPLSLGRRSRLERELARLEAAQSNNPLNKRVNKFMASALHIKNRRKFFK